MERRKDSEDNQEDADATEVNTNNSSSSSSDKIVFRKQNIRTNEFHKPSFNKSVSVRKQLLERTDAECNESSTSEKPILKGSKVIMPEYVIGQKVATNKNKKKKLNTNDGEARADDKNQNQKPLLQHLFDDDEGDEGRNDDDDDDDMNVD